MTRNLHFSTKRPTGVAGARTDDGFTAVEVLIVALILSVVAAMAVPFTSNTLALFRVGGDSRALVNGVSMTKMRAASDFSRARFYVDLAARSFRVEVWSKTAPQQWVQRGWHELSLPERQLQLWRRGGVATRRGRADLTGAAVSRRRKQPAGQHGMRRLQLARDPS